MIRSFAILIISVFLCSILSSAIATNPSEQVNAKAQNSHYYAALYDNCLYYKR